MLYTKFKVCIFGDAGVGKTTLVNRYLTGIFDSNYKITIGADFHLKKLIIDDKDVTLQIWDFAGESKFRFLLPSYVAGSAGGIFMYDITRISSIQSCKSWLEILASSFDHNMIDIPLLMVGGKLDLESKRTVFKEEVSQMASIYDFSENLECSAKTGRNVEEIFKSISKNMLDKFNH